MSLTLLVVSCSLVSLTLSQDYTYWCTGNCGTPVNPSHHPGLILMGGGTDVDAAFIQQAEWSGCGDFLVIRSTRDNDYDEYIYNLTCVNSASTLYSGDQSTYLHDWVGSDMQKTIQSAIDDRNVPIGGTSAGCDIQSYFIYSASNGSVYSDEALANPYNEYMTFANYFILQNGNILDNTIIDTHFVTRKRFGRLIAFVARMRTDSNYGKGSDVKGIGINEHTAIAIDLSTGIGKMLGPERTSEAYILLPGEGNDPEICEPHRPLTYTNVPTQKLYAENSDYFNFITWSGGQSKNYYNVSYIDGIPQQDSYNP